MKTRNFITVTGEDGREHPVVADPDGFVPKVLEDGRRCYCGKYPKCYACRFHDHDEMTAEERKFWNTGDWRINRAKCLECGETVTSASLHDFRKCRCGNLAVDGGSWYLRRMSRAGNGSYEEMSAMYADAK
ncbi:MAG: hypothetical protein WC455_10620 [Dehalococcoidia bacterium]|jgi:uncharacterized CHY-type Zn-finger protein